MSSMLDAMPKILEASRISDGLGLEQRIHALGMGEIIDDTSAHGDAPKRISLNPDMIAPYKKEDLGRPTSARAKPGYEVSVPRTRFCSLCCSREHNAGRWGDAPLLRGALRSLGERHGAPTVELLVIRKMFVYQRGIW